MKLAIKTNKTADITDLIPKFVVFFDASLPVTITRDANNKISEWLDRSLNGFHATQATSGNQPNYTSFNNNFFGINCPNLNAINNGFLRFTIPANFGNINGTLYLATDKYVLQLPINIANSLNNQAFEITGGIANILTGLVLVNGSLSSDEDAKLGVYFRAKGANSQTLTSLNMDLCTETGGTTLYTNPLVKQITELGTLTQSLNTTNLINLNQAFRGLNKVISFPSSFNTSNVASIIQTWFGMSSLTSFPLLNFSNVLNCSSAWFNNSSLSSFPAVNLSKASSTAFTWNGCTNLVNFLAMDFRACNNFQETWRYCKLNQASVDEILISIAAGLANNPTKILAANGGSFTLTGGTNAAPGTINRRSSWAANAWEFNLSQVNETGYNFTTGITGQQAKNWLALKGWAIATN